MKTKTKTNIENAQAWINNGHSQNSTENLTSADGSEAAKNAIGPDDAEFWHRLQGLIGSGKKEAIESLIGLNTNGVGASGGFEALGALIQELLLEQPSVSGQSQPVHSQTRDALQFIADHAHELKMTGPGITQKLSAGTRAAMSSGAGPQSIRAKLDDAVDALHGLMEGEGIRLELLTGRAYARLLELAEATDASTEAVQQIVAEHVEAPVLAALESKALEAGDVASFGVDAYENLKMMTYIDSPVENRRSVIRRALAKVVFGQNDGIDQLAVDVAHGENREDKDRLIAFSEIRGPPGSGKTRAVRALADVVYDGRISTLVSTELMQPHEVAALLFNPGEGVSSPLAQLIGQQPKILVFDEIEKASPDLLEIINGFRDHGFVEDSLGQRIDGSNLHIITIGLDGDDFVALDRAARSSVADKHNQQLSDRLEALGIRL